MLQRIEIVVSPEEAAEEAKYPDYLAKKIGCRPEDLKGFRLARRSIDARSKQPKIRMFFDVALNEALPTPEKILRAYRNVSNAEPVLVIGAGPAGMFAALRLIELGYKPIIIERGKDVRSRRRDLASINREGEINPDSNYCFGEGGAGTYSDGKLYTRSDKRGNIQRVLHTFVEFGAAAEILIEAHPHIGTNKLPGIVTALREQLMSCGAEVLFNTRLEKLIVESGKLKGAIVKSVTENTAPVTISAKALILATGHSARDIFKMLHEQNILIESKAFALGVRIEHPQEIIDSIQYHCNPRSEYLPPASYSLTMQAAGRGVYSFCMCPGGIIAPASTAPGELVVNGWSPSKRNNPFANSGMVVSVDEDDFKPFAQFGPLAAMYFQQKTEQDCFKAGGGKLVAPAQRLTDFCEGNFSTSLPSTSYIPGVSSVELKEILPKAVGEALRIGLKESGKKMNGYYTKEAVLVATESRTSSPVRIPRDKESCMHPEVQGLFPCAEGAGYAGGIVSAAMDGERCAEAISKFLSA
ncbi:FAD-binding protein [soil metagenome]